ncbi:MAG: DNA replication and repair protein RecF [Myxococcales bacterium]|nr:DNA replication and repair protein RecF [Myxococcales bacterium]
MTDRRAQVDHDVSGLTVDQPTLRIERLFVRGFRNLAPLDLIPGARLNVLHGDNGAGKSSLLEAIGYLGTLASFRGARADDMVQLGADHATLKARVVTSARDGDPGGSADEARSLQASVGRGKARRLELDGKRPRSIARWRAALTVVIFHPGELELASGPDAPRRAFVDRVLVQVQPAYATSLAAYTKALRSRNWLLKHGSATGPALAAFDALLETHGAALVRARARLVEALGPRVERAVGHIVGEALPLAVRYRPRVGEGEGAIAEALARSADRDRARGFTAEGPHADAISLEVRQVSARRHASQGQHRAIALAMKVAELELLASRTGRVPVLLLDDVSSELDRVRNRRFFALLGALGGQVFLTTTRPELIDLDEPDRVDIALEEGRVAASSTGD